MNSNFKSLIEFTQKSDWFVFAFALNKDIIKDDGSLDELYGVIVPLKSFNNQKEAENYAKNVIVETGHPGVIVCRYGIPIPLTVKFNPKTVVDIPIDTYGRLVELESSYYKKEKEQLEKQEKIKDEILKESEEETNPNSIEYFKRQCYLAIKSYSNYCFHEHEFKVALENYNKHKLIIRKHYNQYPEHEKEWLNYLKNKLIQRGELSLYNSIENAYRSIRNDLLGIK
ncbi:MAG: hypothetical protein QXG00_02510 [Candidatus Woesearchaeota archaeon]